MKGFRNKHTIFFFIYISLKYITATNKTKFQH